MNEQLPDSTLTELLKAAEYGLQIGAKTNCTCPYCRLFTPQVRVALVKELIERRAECEKLRKQIADAEEEARGLAFERDLWD